MKRILLANLLLFHALTCVCGEGPVITFLDKRVLEYGDVKAGEPIEIAIRFKNSGDKPLRILEIHPSCTCTDAKTPDYPINPGEESSILLKVETKGKRGPQVLIVSMELNTERGYEIIRVNVNYV